MFKSIGLLRLSRGVKLSTLIGCGLCLFGISRAVGVDFDIQQIADPEIVNRTPAISETGLIAWYGYQQTDIGDASSDVYVYLNGRKQNLTQGNSAILSADVHPQVQSNRVVWVTTFDNSESLGDMTWEFKQVPQAADEPVELDANYKALSEHDGAGGSVGRQWFDGPTTNINPDTGDIVRGRSPSGENEIALWQPDRDITRITRDTRNDLGPGFYGDLIAWQKAKGWPFGWEIMVWEDGYRNQLTTNFYYDMGPKVHGRQVVWYGWDGKDFEIYLYDRAQDTVTQITSNSFDDVSPCIFDGMIVWEAYPAVEADIFMWKDGQIQKLSGNIEDDVNPRIWGDKAVWQGFDGEDFEIYFFDGEKTERLTDNEYDDLNPDIGEGLITWMGYHDNWDAEIFVQPFPGGNIQQLTDNEYEDRDPRTAGGRVVWQATDEDQSMIFLAEPK